MILLFIIVIVSMGVIFHAFGKLEQEKKLEQEFQETSLDHGNKVLKINKNGKEV